MGKNFINNIFIKDVIALKKEAENRARTRLENIAWPSEAMVNLGPVNVGECARAMFYKIIGAKATDEMNVRGRYICDAGIMYEKNHIDRFKELGMFVDEQVRIEYETQTVNKVVVTGRMDVVIKDQGVKKGIEIKSVSAFKASDIFGTSGKMPLPAANNLMQAMLYKYWTKYIPEGKAQDIDEVYLMYVNRSDGATFYYKVDLDAQGYPILTAYDQQGNEIYNINLQDSKSYEQLISGSGIATRQEGKLAELRININDIFSKFDEVYTHSKKKILPPTDYKMLFSPEDLEREFKLGRITKRKLTMVKKGTSPYSDYRCSICSFQKRCLSDSGINFK